MSNNPNLIEAVIIGKINTNDVPAFAELPDSITGKFLIVEKKSEAKTDIRKANIVVKAYADSMLDAAELDEATRAKMFTLYQSDGVYSVDHIDSKNALDTSLKKYMYESAYEVGFYY